MKPDEIVQHRFFKDGDYSASRLHPLSVQLSENAVNISTNQESVHEQLCRKAGVGFDGRGHARFPPKMVQPQIPAEIGKMNVVKQHPWLTSRKCVLVPCY